MRYLTSHSTLHGPRGEHHGDDHGPDHPEPGSPPHARAAAHRRGPRRERMFDAGGLKLIALHLIAQQASHGYDVIRAIAELVGGDYTPSPGAVYPTLSFLVDMGHATASDLEGGRKQYAITPEGRQALHEQREAVHYLLNKLSQRKARQARQRPAVLVRAVENFRAALRLKLEGGAASEALVATLAEIIDQAALQVEKA